MASTIRSEDDTKEFFDSPDELEGKVSRLVSLIQRSKHFIVFTGAGISTSAGIPDFRSGINTSLQTGPGVWELRAKGVGRDPTKHKTIGTTKAIPTPTHMAYLELINKGILKAVISQNTDGLLRRTGLPVGKLFELHGNSNVEKCSKCRREYLRDFRTRTAWGVHSHMTGRKCDDPECGGDLHDTIINFGESLPEETLEESFEHAYKADLCLSMGSSLTVTPAADIPKIVGKDGQLVIVNLQSTPLDSLAVRINGKCDDVMRLLMSKLGLEIPQFRLKRRVVMSSKPVNDKFLVRVEGRDIEDHPFSFLKSVSFSSGSLTKFSCYSEPYTLTISQGEEITVKLGFHSHYGEPELDLLFDASKGVDVVVDLSFDPYSGQWSVTRSDGSPTEQLAHKMAAVNLPEK